MKILFVGQNLETGGIQAALVNTLKQMVASNNYDSIELFLFSQGELIKELPKEVKVIYATRLLNVISMPFEKVIKSKNIVNILLRILSMIIVRIIGSESLYSMLFKINKNFNKYDIAISYFNDVPNNYFNQGTNKYVIENINADKKVAWIHTDPIVSGFNKKYCENIYRKYDVIVCVSKACKNKFNEFIPEYKCKTTTVYNMFPINEILLKSKMKKVEKIDNKINIVTVARIDNKSKRIDRIIKVCKMLKDNGITNFRWTIVGEGPDLIKNIEYSKSIGIQDLLNFEGKKNNPYPFIANSDLFVLTSAYEGYPMVIGEAIILKTPILTTKYAAVDEQVKNGVYGVVCENCTVAIYESIKEILLNEKILLKYKKELQKHEFNNDISLKQLNNVLKGKRVDIIE